MKKNPITRARNLGFVCGATQALAIVSLHQDWLGLKAYRARLAEHWTSPSISVPLAILALAGACAVMWTASDRTEEEK